MRRSTNSKIHFERQYAEVFRNLGRPLRALDRLSATLINSAESRLNTVLPGALRSFYQIAGGAKDFTEACDRFLEPADWSLEGRHLVFAEGHQAVVLYGIRVDQPELSDPPVFIATNGTWFRWYKVSASVSEFASVFMHWNGTFAGAMSCVGSALATRGVGVRLRRNWSYVGEVNRMRAYSQVGRSVCYLKWSDGWRVFVGTRSEQDLAALANELGITLDKS